VHDLRPIDSNQPHAGFDWNRRFDDAAIAQMRDAPADVLKLVEHEDFVRAVPTPDHFIPLLYFAGYAAACGERPDVLIDGYAYGSLSMTCFAIGATSTGGTVVDDAAPQGLDAVPAEQTNL
jgi:4,5-DOPA dioxygenase extradiol